MNPLIGLRLLDAKELSLSLLNGVGFHIVENKEQLIFHGGEGAIFIGAVGSILTRLAFKGKVGDIGLESNPKKR